ncbi:MAG: SMI1/KNR4 family protein [Lachnospiraceae bacterium]|nr:SMI1/KNR4 family protein [Robinsoniella sp.]MDY3766091.1 SMI1/KNR4 family protein [Lachnospiraceae bacterium]
MLISKNKSEKEIIDIKVLEAKIGCAVPLELTLFLEKFNGGITPKTSFRLNGISSDVVAFYGIGDLKYSYNDVKILKTDEGTYLPIAFDTFGNIILMDIDRGYIVFQDHESGSSLTVLAPNLKSFINSCKSSPINPASLKSVEEREQDLIKRGRGNIITEELRKLWQEEREKYSKIRQEEVFF